MFSSSRKSKLIAEINITPFTDVILVLLIIFMITTPLVIQSTIKINLPEAASATPAQMFQSQVRIVITNEGLIYLDDKLMTEKELREALRTQHQEKPDLEVVLLADKLVRFKEIVDVLDILHALNIRKLNITTRSEK